MKWVKQRHNLLCGNHHFITYPVPATVVTILLPSTYDGIMWPTLIPWLYTTDLCPPGCRWAPPQCCSPPPPLFCPRASSSYGSCVHGSRPGSWQLPCLPQGRLTGCPWCPPPPGAGCTPPAKRTNSKVWQKWWWSDVFNILIYCNSPMIQSNKINTKHISSSDLNAQTSFLFRIKFKGFINRCSTD